MLRNAAEKPEIGEKVTAVGIASCHLGMWAVSSHWTLAVPFFQSTVFPMHSFTCAALEKCNLYF